MNFKKKRLDKALEDKTYRVKLVHSKKGWLTIGLTFVTLFSATMLSQKTVDASAVNNVAIANSTTSSSVQLWNSVTSKDMHKAGRGLANGTAWKTAKAVTGIDGQTYLLVGGNEYANANEMDLADETSNQSLSGVVVTNSNKAITRLYTNPLAENGATLITNRGLGRSTAWKTDQKVVVNGQTYYRVATNEWVKADDAYLTSESSRSDKTYTKNAPDAETTTSTDNTNNSSNSNSGSHNNSGSTTTPTSKTATVTIHYVDSIGKQISKDTTTTQKIGSDYDAIAPEIDGYTSKDASKSVKVAKGNNEITFTYLSKDEAVNYRPVTIQYEDENGGIVGKTQVVQAEIGKDYTATAQDVDGYTLQGDKTQTINVSKDNVNTITFTYKKDVTTADVTVNYVDESGNAITDAKVVPSKIGSDVTEEAKDLKGYTLVGDKTQTVTVGKDGNQITFKYKKDADTTPETKTANVTVKYLDDNGDEVNPAKTLTGQKVGSTISEDAPTFEGYDLTSDKTATTTVAEDGSSVITFTYKAKDTTTPVDKTANVTVKYVDTEGNVLQTPNTLVSQKVGSTISENAPVFEGYTVDQATKTVTVAKDNNVITFTYTKDAVAPKTATVTTKFVDEQGKEIAKSATDTTEIGKDFTAKAVDVDGYTVNGDSTQTSTIDGDKTITFTYTKNAEPVKDATITVKYQLADGTTIKADTTDTAKVGDKYSKDAPEIDGYALSGDATQSIDSVTGDATLTFTYTKNEVAPKVADVTVNYVSEDGTVLQSAKTDSADIDSTYKVDAPAIDGYAVKGDSTKSITVAKDNNVITFTYTKDAPVQTVDTSAVSAKIISLVNDYRTSNGLKALNVDSNLSAGAVARSITEKNHVDASGDINSANHDEFNAQSQANLQQYGSTNMAENLAVTSGNTVDEVAQNLFDQWKGSAEHNKTMLDASMTDIGVGTQPLANGQYVAIQDFGGNAQAGVTWDSSKFNTASISSVGLTKDQISQQMATTYGLTLGTNYYVSDYIFKTKGDYESFMASAFETPDPLEGSIWDSVGASGRASTALIYDANGNAVGWGLALLEMDEPVSTYTSEGLTTWIK